MQNYKITIITMHIHALACTKLVQLMGGKVQLVKVTHTQQMHLYRIVLQYYVQTQVQFECM